MRIDDFMTEEDPPPKEEASADMRAVARTMRDMYVAFVQENFTPTEALTIIGMILAQSPDRGDDERNY